MCSIFVGFASKKCYTKEKKYKSVILISDGEDHDEAATNIAGQMANDGVSVNTIGIGSSEGTTLLDPVTNEIKKDNEGNTVISKLNEQELIAIAEKGGGIYQLFTNTDDLVSKLESQLENMDQRTITEDSQVNYMNYFPYFLAAAFILLILEFFVSETRGQRRQRSTPYRRAIRGMRTPGGCT